MKKNVGTGRSRNIGIDKSKLAIGTAPKIIDPDYRKWLSTMPCLDCKIEGFTQAAHLKIRGRGLKDCDTTCAPLCTIHPCKDRLIEGCHERYDRYKPSRIREHKDQALDIMKLVHSLYTAKDFKSAENIIRAF